MNKEKQVELRKDDYWVAEVQVAPGTRMFRTVVNIYRVDKSGDIAFIMCGDERTYWRSQFEWFDLIRKVELK